jgi:hypothetical protein
LRGDGRGSAAAIAAGASPSPCSVAKLAESRGQSDWPYYGWHSGYWNYWRTPPAFWVGSGLAAASLLSPGDTFVYSNPYYAAPSDTTVVVQPALDYSAAIPTPIVCSRRAICRPPC